MPLWAMQNAPYIQSLLISSRKELNVSKLNELFISFLIFFFVVWQTMLRNCLFAFFKSLACHALQTETIIKKITQPKLPKTKNKRTKFVMSQTKDKGFTI